MIHYSERLTTENTEMVYQAKIGTFTPKRIWVHEDDMPLVEEKTFRYLDHEPTDHGFYPDYGCVEEIRERVVDIKIHFVKEGFPRNVEALDLEDEE